MKSAAFVLFAACVGLVASHAITRDLLVPTPDLYSELENVTIDEPANDVPFKNCGSPSDLVSIASLSLTPFPAKKGQTVSTLITGTLNKGFNTGKWSVTVQSGIIKKTVTGDICEELKQKGKSCPVAAGPVNKLYILWCSEHASAAHCICCHLLSREYRRYSNFSR